jgi:hypothetical protein
MKTYTFWYSEEYTYKAGFQAESLEEATKLINEVFEGDTAIEDLPAFWSKDKGYESDYSPETLEEHED